MTGERRPGAGALRAVKVVHTIVWAIFAGAIVALPIVAFLGELTAAVSLIALVSIEVGILFANRMRCPLTDVAARYTTDRRANFDIYLPEWIARYNKQIFGTLFFLGILVTAIRWLST